MAWEKNGASERYWLYDGSTLIGVKWFNKVNWDYNVTSQHDEGSQFHFIQRTSSAINNSKTCRLPLGLYGTVWNIGLQIWHCNQRSAKFAVPTDVRCKSPTYVILAMLFFLYYVIDTAPTTLNGRSSFSNNYVYDRCLSWGRGWVSLRIDLI